VATIIARRALDAVLAHAEETSPSECCGILLGDGDRILAAVRARNIDADPNRRFLINPSDHIDARRSARREGLDVVGFYHSHPASGAYPSPADIAESSYPDAVSLIAGMKAGRFEARLFRLRNAGVEELTFDVADA
jgi:proteasome lid subunit RPN8/RPN11